ncbi:MAG: FAD-dependent monooxygenase [Deltaproteobacteria bacterium]|nr:FAD-dependent monooxygenase [Deltaproteobacteria bacterium]
MATRVIICGAGIGGLTAGIALRQRGFGVRILERVARIEPVGAGITVQVNAMRVMRRLGLADAIAAAGALVTRGAIRGIDGRVIRSMDQGDLAARYGAPFVAIHRARLHEVLLKAFDGEVVTGAAVAGVVAADDGAVVKLVGNATHDAAILVGADGLRSTVREALFGAEALRAAAQVSWRCVCPGAAAGGDPGGETWGPGARFGFVPIGDGEVYWYAAMDKIRAPSERVEQHAALAGIYRDWHAPIPELLRATHPAQVIRTELFDRPPTRTWGRGAVTLLGDAAHPMTPNLGQGGCQAIEDAWILARELARDPSPAGLRRYESLRQPRTRRFVEESWRFGKMAQSSSPLVTRVRDFAMRRLPEPLMRRSLAWSFDFDPDA